MGPHRIACQVDRLYEAADGYHERILGRIGAVWSKPVDPVGGLMGLLQRLCEGSSCAFARYVEYVSCTEIFIRPEGIGSKVPVHRTDY